MEAEKSHSAKSSDGGFLALHSTISTLLSAGNPEPVTCTNWRSTKPVLGATATVAGGGGGGAVPVKDTETAADSLKSLMAAAFTTHFSVAVTQSTVPVPVLSLACTVRSVANAPVAPAGTKRSVLKSQSLGLRVLATSPRHWRTATSAPGVKPAPVTCTTWPSARPVVGSTASEGGGGGATEGSKAIDAAPDSPPGTGSP